MIYYKQGITAEIKDGESDDDRIQKIITYFDANGNGYYEHDVKVDFHSDGSLSFWSDGDDGHVYLYPAQTLLLFKLLEANKKWMTKHPAPAPRE